MKNSLKIFNSVLLKLNILLLFLWIIFGQNAFSQTYQSNDNGRDGLVVAYDISYSFEKRATSYLAIRLICTPKSINKITYLGKVYSSSDFPASIIQSLMTSVSTTRPKVHFDLYNGGTFLTKWTSSEQSFTIGWSRVFNHQSTGDAKTNDAAIQQLNKQGQAMVDAGGLRLNITGIDNVLFNTNLIDDFLRESLSNTVRPVASNNTSGPSMKNTPPRGSASNSNSSTSSNGQSNNMTETQMRDMELKRQLAALEQRQKEKQEMSQAINTGIEGVANMFAQGIREDQARTAAREESNSLRRDKNAVTGNFLLNQYKADAEKGNETAISKVIEAYHLLDNATEQKAFMHAMVDKYESQVALGALTAFYNSKINTYKSTNNRYTRRGIFKLVFYTGIGVGLAHLGSEINIYDEPERATEADVLTYSGGGMMIFGVMAGIITMFKSGDIQEYNEAQQGLQRLQQRVKLSFSPKIDLSRSYGMAVKLTF